MMLDLIAELRNLLANSCKIRKVHPAVCVSDAEVSNVLVALASPSSQTHAIKAYKDGAKAIREFIRARMQSES